MQCERKAWNWSGSVPRSGLRMETGGAKPSGGRSARRKERALHREMRKKPMQHAASRANRNGRTVITLFITQGLDGIEVRSLPRGIDPEDQSDAAGDKKRRG